MENFPYTNFPERVAYVLALSDGINESIAGEVVGALDDLYSNYLFSSIKEEERVLMQAAHNKLWEKLFSVSTPEGMSQKVGEMINKYGIDSNAGIQIIKMLPTAFSGIETRWNFIIDRLNKVACDQLPEPVQRVVGGVLGTTLKQFQNVYQAETALQKLSSDALRKKLGGEVTITPLLHILGEKRFLKPTHFAALAITVGLADPTSV